MGGTLSLQAVCTVAMMCSTVTHVDRLGAFTQYNTIISGSEFHLAAGKAGVNTALLFLDDSKTTVGRCQSDATEGCQVSTLFTAPATVASVLGFSVVDEAKKVFGNTEFTVVAPVPSQPRLALESAESLKLTASSFARELGANTQLTGCALFYGLSTANYEAEDTPKLFNIAELPANAKPFSLAETESASVKLSALELMVDGTHRSVSGDQLDFHFVCYNALGSSSKASLYNVRAGKPVVSHKFAVKQMTESMSSSSGMSLSSGMSSSSGLSSSSAAPSVSSSSESIYLTSSSSPDTPAISSSSSVYVESSSAASSSGDVSSSAADSSSSGNDKGVSSSGASVSSSAGVSTGASSSSTGPAPVIPTGTVQLSMQVNLPYAVNASNYAQVTASLQQDIASNLADAFNTTADVLAPYIVITGLGNFGTFRRLLQTGEMRLGFLILGNISNVVTTANVTDVSQIGTAVAETLARKVQDGSFTSTSSGATVPPQTIVITPVSDPSSSSSSTGYSLPEDDSSSSGLSGGAIAGIVIGVVVGAALIIGAVAYAVLRSGNKPAPVTDGNEIEARQSSPKNGLPIKTFDEPVAVVQQQSAQPTDFHNDNATDDYQV